MPNAVKRIVLFVLIMLALALIWRYLVESDVISSEKIQQFLQQTPHWRQQAWLMPTLILLYIVLLSVMFPLTLLVITTGFLFDPAWAMLCAGIGALASSAISFFIGHYVGREAIEKHGGSRIRKAESFMQNNAVNSMIVINLLPIAPFTLTNMLAGAFRMKFIPFMVGSAIGLIPGLIAVIMIGSQMGKILQATEPSQIWQGLAIVLLAIGILAVLINRVRKRSHLDE